MAMPSTTKPLRGAILSMGRAAPPTAWCQPHCRMVTLPTCRRIRCRSPPHLCPWRQWIYPYSISLSSLIAVSS